MTVPAPSRLRVIHAYVRLPHSVPIIAVLTATFAFATLAEDGPPPADSLASVLMAMFGSQIVIGVVNELVDADADSIAKPSKPIPAGLVSRRGAFTLGTIALMAMIVFSARLGWQSLVISSLGTGIGISYSLWFKRTLVAWLPYLIALPLIPIWVFVALDTFDRRLLMLFPLGATAGFAIHLAQSLPDVAGDRVTGVRNLTAVLGEPRSLTLIVVAFAAASLAAAVTAAVWIDSPRIVLTAAVAGAAIVAGDAWVYRRNQRLGVMACFPCVAAGTAILGIAWVVAMTR